MRISWKYGLKVKIRVVDVLGVVTYRNANTDKRMGKVSYTLQRQVAARLLPWVGPNLRARIQIKLGKL